MAVSRRLKRVPHWTVRPPRGGSDIVEFIAQAKAPSLADWVEDVHALRELYVAHSEAA